MMILTGILILTSLTPGTDHASVDGAPLVSPSYDWLVYDDGTPYWLTWTGTYRGVWFNTSDFVPGGWPYEVGTAELWFYHHSSYPWDTSHVYIEIWNGDSMGPCTELGQVEALALHYAPIYIVFNPMLEAEDNFWCVVNTELSAGGWPSTLTDGAQGYIYHSFYSDDFVVWEPYDRGGACNYFISVADMIMGTDLSRVTWGGLKTVF